MSESQEQVIEPTEQVVNEQVTEPNYEDLASRQGWVPQDKWHGNPALWKDAKSFYEDGEKFAPYIRANNRKLEDKVDELTGKIIEVTRWANTQQAQLRQQLETQTRENQRLITQLQIDKANAIREGDGVKVVDIENKIDTLKAQVAASPVQQAQPQVDPVVQAAFQAWHLDNTWYGRNRPATAMADAAANEYRATHPNALPIEVFKAAEIEVKQRFPEFNTSNQNLPSPEGVGKATTVITRKNASKHTYADLPIEDKRVCDMVVSDAKRKNFAYTREQFVKEYFGEQ